MKSIENGRRITWDQVVSLPSTRGRARMPRIAAVAAVLIATATTLVACSRDAARSEAAEAKAQPPAAEATKTLEDTLVQPLLPCNTAAALAAMSSTHARTRAAGAACAARTPCAEGAIDLPLSRLADDNATAVEYVDRGPMFGSGDQTVRVSVSHYALRAAALRRMACRSS